MLMAKRGRPKGSKNKTKGIATLDLNRKAEHFANLFIGYETLDGAERLAVKILEKIRASKERLEKKYG